jgi:hypothetical protein
MGLSQLRLFEVEPVTEDLRPVRPMVARAANADPVTSYIAADQVEGSGRASSHRRILLEWLREHGGEHTSAELGVQTGLGRHEAARRLPELREGGLIENGAARPCRVRGTRAITWRIRA